MCLTVFAWSYHPQWPLILLSNRDEYHHRASQNTSFWQKENHHIFAGKDLQSGGVWLGASTFGKFANITNFREPQMQNYPKSRGMLTLNFLKSQTTAINYFKNLGDHTQCFAGFNLLLLDNTGLWYANNRQAEKNKLHYQLLSPGVYGLCNHLLDTPWPKLLRIKSKFKQQIDTNALESQSMIELMMDKWKPKDNELPETGMTQEYERLRSSCFIKSTNYGTQFTSYIKINNQQQLFWAEHRHLASKEESNIKKYNLPFH